MTEHEIERIRDVYRRYMPGVRSRWDRSNRGYAAILAERDRCAHRLLSELGDLDRLRLIDVGCGTGGVLNRVVEWGVRPERCWGVDLLPERIDLARTACPRVTFRVVDGSVLPVPDEAFDVALAFTVFSSIKEARASTLLASEIARVLKPGGAVLWYDIRYNNPWNANVRGIGTPALRHLFPDFSQRLKSITLLPPIARRLGSATRAAYAILAAVPPLRSHYLGLLTKPSAAGLLGRG